MRHDGLRRLVLAAGIAALAALGTQGRQIAAPDVIGYWHLDDPDGHPILDSSGNGHDGEPGGTHSAAGACGQARVTATPGITIPFDPAFDMSQPGSAFTIEAFVFMSEHSWAGTGIVHKADQYAVWFGSYGARGLYYLGIWSAEQNTWIYTVLDETFPIGRWVHTAATWDGTTVKLYLDHELKKTATVTAAPSPGNQPLVIAMAGSDLPTTGVGVDEVRVSRGALEPSQFLPLGCSQDPGDAGLVPTTVGEGSINRAMVADVDNDGRMELLSAVMDPSRVDVFKWSDGQYTLWTSLPFPQWPASLAVDDTDGDGRNELVVGTGQSDAGGYVYVGEITGTPPVFAVEWQSEWIGTIRYGRELAVGDGDGDGRKEIAVAVSWYGRRLQVYEFDGSTYRHAWGDNIGSDTDSLQYADVNGDGREELLVGTACWSDYGVRVYNGSSLAFARQGIGRTDVTAGDLNGDGALEIATGSGTWCGGSPSPVPAVTILGFGGAGYTPLFSASTPIGAAGRVLVAAGRLSGAPADELAYVTSLVNNGNQHVGVFRWDGGSWTKAWSWSAPAGLYLTSVSIADADNDGRNELVVGTSHGVRVFDTPNQPPLADAGPDQTLEATGPNGALAPLSGLASTDPDGDPLTYIWKDENGNSVGTQANITVQVALGSHVYTLTVDDAKGGTASDDVAVTVQDTKSPSVTSGTDTTELWPPNGTMRAVAISGSAIDTGIGVATVGSYKVTDEYGLVQPQGTFTVSPTGTYSFVVNLEARRLGTDQDGRTYLVAVTVEDANGNAATSTVKIVVPHDQGN
jgi:hypothetical protein